ncbi:MAG TPA: CRTAC1 family protein, partial [Acidobacteriaceae bacterium]|nr:CRTAC1 family protein [Acidobacteriaceae bacterium]
DNDGWLDLFVANGHVYPEVDSSHLGSDYREPRLLYHNLGNGKFADITKDAGPGITTPASARGLAVADLWNDGRQEVVINDVSSLPMLLVNFAPNNNHWIGLALTGTKSNRSAIGARVTLRGTTAGGTAAAKERVWVNEVRSGSSYNSSSDMRLHFGLGPSAMLHEVEVSWPSGLTELFPAPPIDRITTLTEGAGKPLTAKAAK